MSQRMNPDTQSRLVLLAAVMIAVGSLAACSGSANAAKAASAVTYSSQRLQLCVRAKKVLTSWTRMGSYKASYRRRFPPGTVGTLVLVGNDDRRLGPLVDSATVVFFKTAAQAAKDATPLIKIILYNPDFAFIYPPPPSFGAARRMVATIGNFVVVWSYPRHHPAASNRLLRSCLSSSKTTS